MKNTLSFLLALLPAFCAAQQAGDSLFIREESGGRWMARYRVQAERSVFEVARKFAVPAAVVADANHLSYTERLAAGTMVKVPLTVANWYNYPPPSTTTVTPLFYRATEDWDAKDLAKRIGISKRQLLEWNSRNDGTVNAGQVLAVGWISTDGSVRNDVSQNSATVPPPPSISWPDTIVVIDTAKPVPVLSPMEQAFQDQTAGGTMVTTEKGPAAFFPASGGTIKGVHYAFHNMAARGSIVRVHNPGTGRTVYVKVLGPLPATEQYAGAIIGISAAAKAELGVRGDARAWCEVSYAGY